MKYYFYINGYEITWGYNEEVKRFEIEEIKKL